MAFYNMSDREGSVTISVFFEDGDTRVVPKTSPTFQPLLDYLLANDSHDEDEIRRLVDPAVFIGTEMAEVSDRVSYDLHDLYFDGKPMRNLIAQHVKAMIQQGDQNWKGLVRFMVNLDDNPSRNAQNATYAWVERHGLTLTEDGCFLGYKAVLEDHTSSHAGPDNYINGEYYGEPGQRYHVPHNVGDVISKKRADVDDTPGGGCSVGLHVGTYDYAKGFAPVLMTVKVNPRDVVSADETAHNFKIRVCSYEVIALNEDKVDFIGKTTSTNLDQPNITTEYGHKTWLVVDHGLPFQYQIVMSFDTEDEADEFLDSLYESEEDEERDLVVLHRDDRYGDETVREIPTLAEEEPEDIGSGSWDNPVADVLNNDVEEHRYDSLAEAEQAKDKQVLKILKDRKQGHKPVARTLVDEGLVITTESSVRRWRKAHGVVLG